MPNTKNRPYISNTIHNVLLIGIFALTVGLLLSCSSSRDSETTLRGVDSIHFEGRIRAPEDISSITKLGTFLLIGSDEGTGPDENENYIQVLRKTSNNRYEFYRDIHLFDGNKKDGREMDIEGLAASGSSVFVIGSHSLKRKRIKENKKYKRNLKTLLVEEIEYEKSRDWLYRLSIDERVNVSAIERISLRKLINADGVLNLFGKVPSKENGVDIEGIATSGDWLYLGLRSPVLRENYVPILRLKFDDPEATYELLYVNLGGRGIRDISSVSDGFLIIAGPPGDGLSSYQLYHWDGRDTIPGKDRDESDIGVTKLLGEVNPPNQGKAEGIVLLEEHSNRYEVIIVYDGIDGGGAQRFHILKH